MSGRERYLQIESARVGIDIYNFARKIQTVYELRLHRFRVYLRGLYAAGGDNRLFDRAKVSYRNSEMLEQINELRALFAGDGIDLCVHGYARERDYDGHELFGEQEVERIYKIAVVVLAEIAQDARIELLLRKRRLEVDNNFISPPLHLTHM